VASTSIVVEQGESDNNRKVQYLIYFISDATEKLAYALLITSYKLSHYFQAHQIKVRTSSTLGEVLNNSEATEKIVKWVIELSMYDIIFKPRTAIKAQALSDFITEWTETQSPPPERELEYWTTNFDGSLQL
jgi:hypothetical protein